jgi:hypothetical protein
MKTVKVNQNLENIQIEEQLIKSIANSLAEEMARKMHYKLLLLKFLPETYFFFELMIFNLKLVYFINFLYI